MTSRYIIVRPSVGPSVIMTKILIKVVIIFNGYSFMKVNGQLVKLLLSDSRNGEPGVTF